MLGETSSGLWAEVNAASTHDSTSVKLKMPPKSDARTSILSSITELRQRCPALQSLQAEYTVITTLEVYLSQGLVSTHMPSHMWTHPHTYTCTCTVHAHTCAHTVIVLSTE